MNSIGQIVVNEQGGLEIPKSMCEQVGFQPGVKLLVEKNGDGEIRLRPSEDELVETIPPDEVINEAIEGEAELIEKNGMLVIRGGENLDILALIKQDREERMRKLMEGFPI
ncbi:MAG: hypothetical protein ACRD9Y_07505 [Blastocatellia bacterium]